MDGEAAGVTNRASKKPDWRPMTNLNENAVAMTRSRQWSVGGGPGVVIYGGDWINHTRRWIKPHKRWKEPEKRNHQ